MDERNDPSSISEGSSSSDRKRKLPMIGSKSSSSDTNIPNKKPGHHHNGHTSSGDLSNNHITDALPISSFWNSKKAMVGDGSHRLYNYKPHICTAIIHDKSDVNCKGVICKLQCHLGDRVRYELDPIPVRKVVPHTGAQCADQSLREIIDCGYNYIKQIYTGQFSNIYLGFTEVTQKYVVFKLINKGNHDCCKRSLRKSKPCVEQPGSTKEGDYLATLKHPNVISLISKLVTSVGKSALVLEFCALGKISSILSKTGFMSESVARKYFHQMFAAISYLHSEGFAVRNISLSHFLLTNSNQVKLVDLSQLETVNQAEAPSKLASINVTGYQAPETVSSNRHRCYSGPVDIWALGVCLYSMVTGIPTTRQHSTAISYNQGFSFPSQSILILSESLHELLAGMLLYIPEQRYTISRVEHSDWFSSSNGKLAISGYYLLRAPQKITLSAEDVHLRQLMEL